MYICEKGSTALKVREHVENDGASRSTAAAPFLKANAHPRLEWESVGHETVRKAATLSAQRELYMEEKGSPGKLCSNLSSHWKTLVRIGAAPSGSERSGGMIRRLHKRQLSTRL